VKEIVAEHNLKATRAHTHIVSGSRLVFIVTLHQTFGALFDVIRHY
jgi:hypothetical protein